MSNHTVSREEEWPYPQNGSSSYGHETFAKLLELLLYTLVEKEVDVSVNMSQEERAETKVDFEMNSSRLALVTGTVLP